MSLPDSFPSPAFAGEGRGEGLFDLAAVGALGGRRNKKTLTLPSPAKAGEGEERRTSSPSPSPPRIGGDIQVRLEAAGDVLAAGAVVVDIIAAHLDGLDLDPAHRGAAPAHPCLPVPIAEAKLLGDAALHVADQLESGRREERPRRDHPAELLLRGRC